MPANCVTLSVAVLYIVVMTFDVQAFVPHHRPAWVVVDRREVKSVATTLCAAPSSDLVAAVQAACQAAASASKAAEAASLAASQAALAAASALAALEAAPATAAAAVVAEPATAVVEAPAPAPPAPSNPPEPAAKAEPSPAPQAAEPAPAAANGGGGEVTPKLVKELREQTGAGMMDCKKALTEMNGDMEAAVEYLRKKGLAKADKKASRIAAEGKMALTQADDGHKAVLVEVNCETDFVAKDESFLNFCEKVATKALEVSTGADGSVQTDVTGLMSAAGEVGTLEEDRQALVAKIGENIQVRRLASRGTPDTVVGAYVHMNRIGVLVELEGGSPEVAADVAMHVAAMNPPFATAKEVPEEVLNKERAILSAQALESGKPPEIVAKMVEGRIRKYLEEICCDSQTYVKTNDKTVAAYLKEKGAKLLGFTRMTVGEGIEKKQDDFAAEVAKMAAGSK